MCLCLCVYVCVSVCVCVFVFVCVCVVLQYGIDNITKTMLTCLLTALATFSFFSL